MKRHHMKRPNLWQYGVYEVLAILAAAYIIYSLPRLVELFQ